MKRYRILHVIKSLGLGGAETLLVEGRPFVDRSRFDYSYAYFLGWKDKLVPALRAQGAEVTCLGGDGVFGILNRIHALASHVRHEQIDLIHCHLPIASVTARLAGELAGVPVVGTEHNLVSGYHPLTHGLWLASLPKQARLVAVSNEVLSSVRKAAPEYAPCEAIANGVATAKFARSESSRMRIRREFGFADDAFVVGTIAVFRPQKRLDLWLRAAKQLADKVPTARFLLVGDGVERDRLAALVNELGLTDRVVMPGLRDDAPALYSAMDLFMMSSAYEGLPVALLEAMAARLPVLVTRVGGIPEVLTDGVSGFMVDPLNTDALVERALECFANPSLREGLASAAHSSVVERFSVATMVAKYERLYLGVLAPERVRHGQQVEAMDAR